MKTISLFVVLFTITGCSTLSTVQIAAAHTVSKYCSAPEKIRKVLRKGVGKAVKPNAITVVCDVDEPLK